LVVALKVFHYDKLDDDGISCMMKLLFPGDRDKQVTNVLPLMFSNSIDCEVEERTISNLELA
jgi:hypothetical protein